MTLYYLSLLFTHLVKGLEERESEIKNIKEIVFW